MVPYGSVWEGLVYEPVFGIHHGICLYGDIWNCMHGVMRQVEEMY